MMRLPYESIQAQIEADFRSGWQARLDGAPYDPNQPSTGWRHGWKSADGALAGRTLPEKDQAMADWLGLAPEGS